MDLRVATNVNEPVIRITDEQLLDYMKCANLFYFKHLSRIPDSTDKKMGELVKQVINGYFSKLMEQKLPKIDTAKRKWDKLCDANPRSMKDKKILEGFGLINFFDRFCFDNKLIIADFNTPYELVVPGNILISGHIGAIRVINKSLELFEVEPSQTAPDINLLNMSVKYTLQCYAANRLYKDYNLNHVNVLHLKSGKEYRTYRNKIQYDRLENIIRNVAYSIKNEIFYPREDYTCAQCAYKNYCGYK